MRVVILAAGTWGDVRPNMALGQALQNAGYEVLLVTTQEFRQSVAARGLNCFDVQLDMQGLMNAVMGGDGGFFSTIQQLRDAAKVFRPALVQAGKAIADVVQAGDALLMNALTLNWMNGIAEKHLARLIHINLQPQALTRNFPAMGQPAMPERMPFGAMYNRLSYRISQRINWSSLGALGNRVRTEHLALPKQTWRKHEAMLNTTPSLLLASRHVVPRPVDWPAQHRITGYVFDEDRDWQAPPELVNFLEEGEKPIYIGFGSMAIRRPEATMQAILEAVRQSGQRVVLLSGWAGLGGPELPKDLFLLKYAPHHWLFPRMAAVIHHGGAGTTAAGLKAGVPSIIVPFFLDQPFWGRRVHALGVGPRPIPISGLTAEKLSEAIRDAITNRAMQERAIALGQEISVEDGIRETVKAIEEVLA